MVKSQIRFNGFHLSIKMIVFAVFGISVGHAAGPDWSKLPDVLFTNAYPSENASQSREEARKAVTGPHARLFAVVEQSAANPNQLWNSRFEGIPLFRTFVGSTRLKDKVVSLVVVTVKSYEMAMNARDPLVRASIELIGRSEPYRELFESHMGSGVATDPQLHAEFLGAGVFSSPSAQNKIPALDQFVILKKSAVDQIKIDAIGTITTVKAVWFAKHAPQCGDALGDTLRELGD
jgi:hypothetical protein